MHCIVHYHDYDSSRYTKIKKLSTANITRIRNAKFEREKYTDYRRHEAQCISIPDTLDPEIHGVHLQPYYAVFTHILSKIKPMSSLTSPTLPKSPLATVREELIEKDESINFRKCFICKKGLTKSKQKNEHPKIIDISADTESKIKWYLSENNQEWYDIVKDIKDINL